MAGHDPLLAVLLAVPSVGALVLLGLWPRLGGRRASHYLVAVTGLTLALTLVVLGLFDYARAARTQLVLDLPWAPEFGLRFHLGVDGVSLPLAVLTALLTFLGAVYTAGGSSRKQAGDPRAFAALLLMLETGMLGTFVSLDLLLFFVFFEIVLIPMWALIRWWGADGASAAATKFVLYTLLGSALMLTGFLVIGTHTGTLDMVELARRHGAGMSRPTQELAFALVALGFAIKTPMWPLHTWLPDAHTAAPTVGSVLLAGVLLKVGTYGFVRIAVPVLPLGAHAYATTLAAFAVVGIVYGALVCLAQARAADGDLKRLVAYSSVGHMGFVLLGIATLTPVGMNGALFAGVAHGLITGLLFFLAGGLGQRHGSTAFAELGRGLYRRMPRYGALLAFAAVATLGLPGLAGFWGEVLALFATAAPAAGLPVAGYEAMLAIAGIGAVLTAAYALTVVRRLCMGGASQPDQRRLAELDITRHETRSWLPLVGLTVLTGLWPALLLGLTNPVVHTLLAVR